MMILSKLLLFSISVILGVQAFCSNPSALTTEKTCISGIYSDDICVEEIQYTNEELYSRSDEELLALITMAEAEGEPEECKRLVIDTVLNRVDNGYFPNSVSGVIYQSGQFTCVDNGRLDRCYISDYYLDLVRDEMIHRQNDLVLYFTAYNYGAYGEPYMQVGNTYFCI